LKINDTLITDEERALVATYPELRGSQNGVKTTAILRYQTLVASRPYYGDQLFIGRSLWAWILGGLGGAFASGLARQRRKGIKQGGAPTAPGADVAG
jgi:hypothetical protein